MKKGITPVIALVMLMLITVGMVGIAYSWFSGLLTTQTEKGITIPPGGAYCAGGKVSVMIQNSGATSNLVQADIIIAQVDGADATLDAAAFPITPGGGKVIVKDWACGGTCASGSRAVRVGTRTGVVESSAFCK
ncbi:MAG: hypothetical protein HY516_01550 [Candidatus Aenigmarchaeota archaeon]|nr:hypothetical protein [Candidatus Aenigmarchaeota archaeon]